MPKHCLAEVRGSRTHLPRSSRVIPDLQSRPIRAISLLMSHNYACNVAMRSTRPQETQTFWSTFWSMVLGLTNQRGRAKYLTTKISLLRSSRAERIRAIHSRRKIVPASNNLSARASTAAQLSCKVIRTRWPSHPRYALNSLSSRFLVSHTNASTA